MSEYRLVCVACSKGFTLDQRSEADGNCPHCMSEFDLEVEVQSQHEELAALRQQLEEAQQRIEQQNSAHADVLVAWLSRMNEYEGAANGLIRERDDQIANLEQRLANAGTQEAVAWGIPNSRPTERNPLMQVLLDNTSCQYPELLIPLYLHPALPATDERVKELVAALEVAFRHIDQTTHCNDHRLVSVALAASKADNGASENVE